jgi:hypothetical protein
MSYIKARDLEVGKRYIYIDPFGPYNKNKKDMGILQEKGDFKNPSNMQNDPSAILKFENGEKSFDWDEKFIEVKTTSGGKKKSRRNRKSKKLRKNKSRKNSRK